MQEVITIIHTKSVIKKPVKVKNTLDRLKIRRLNQVITVPSSPCYKGMVNVLRDVCCWFYSNVDEVKQIKFKKNRQNTKLVGLVSLEQGLKLLKK